MSSFQVLYKSMSYENVLKTYNIIQGMSSTNQTMKIKFYENEPQRMISK